MGWTGHPSRTGENGRFAAAQAAAATESDRQHRRAARVVAGHSIDAADCAEMLAMLGLDGPEDRAEAPAPVSGARIRRR
jgi:hypothetical protein